MALLFANGHAIESLSGGLNFDSALNFTSAGAGTSQFMPGFHGYRAAADPATVNYWGNPWPITATQWTSGHLNTTTGVFTAPVAGNYLCGYAAICRGGTNYTGASEAGYGYCFFSKNGAAGAQMHWNMTSGNAWENVGHQQVIPLAVGDTLAMGVVMGANVVNVGWYPSQHHSIWVILIG